jgi:hypothetical protein
METSKRSRCRPDFYTSDDHINKKVREKVINETPVEVTSNNSTVEPRCTRSSKMKITKCVVKKVIEYPNSRKKLAHCSTFEHVISLIRKSKRIIVITGAGCG